jgi:SAM-dependent methyltransferase
MSCRDTVGPFAFGNSDHTENIAAHRYMPAGVHAVGMGLYTGHILPRLTDWIMRGEEFSRIRARVLSGLTGDVLEIGFGSGLNVPHYPPGLTRVRAVDPATAGRKLAARRVAASSVPVEHIGTDAQALPLPDASVDGVVSTWTLCTIPDPGRALAEIRRVLRPGGTFHFVEHGRSPDPKVARAQDRFTPLQRTVAGGCHLNRPIGDLVKASGLDITRLDNYYLARSGRIASYMFEGAAAKRGQP